MHTAWQILAEETDSFTMPFIFYFKMFILQISQQGSHKVAEHDTKMPQLKITNM